MCDIQIFLKFGLFIGDLAGFWDRFGRLRYLASGNPVQMTLTLARPSSNRPLGQ